MARPGESVIVVMDEPTQELVNFDRVTWRGVQMPSTKKGYDSRGDVLEGVQPAKPREPFCDGGRRKGLAMGINNQHLELCSATGS